MPVNDAIQSVSNRFESSQSDICFELVVLLKDETIGLL